MHSFPARFAKVWKCWGGWSLLTVVAFALTANTIINTAAVYKKWHSMMFSDQAGYYGHLPAILILDDWEFDFYPKNGYKKEFIIAELPNGKTVDKYSIGPAFLVSPFFLIGHAEALRSDRYPANGLSPPYKHWVILGCIFYVSWGLLLIRSVLRRYYKDVVVALTLLIISIGSNVLYYSTLAPIMSHAYSFFLFALLLWATVRWLEDSRKSALLVIGIALGLIACVRVPNLVTGLIPLLWGIRSTKDIRARSGLVWSQKWWILASLTMFLIGFSPQLIYYKMKVGEWMLSGYLEKETVFWWSQPLFWRVMFSFRNGWLIYSPLMATGVLGFLFLRKHCPQAILPTLSFFLVNMYVVSSWWCWWYGGSFGLRALAESHALLSLPVAATVSAMVHHKFWGYVFSISLPFLITLSIIQAHQHYHGIIHFDGMTWKSYKAVFLELPPASKEALEKRDEHLEFHGDFFRATKEKRYRWEMCK